ncbi:unnamed protein product, partial [Staurois parvus]
MSSLTSAQLISSAAKSSVLQTQQVQNVQIAKKVPASSSGAVITKLIIAKPLNSKPGQTTQVSSVFAGKVLSHANSATQSKPIVITE